MTLSVRIPVQYAIYGLRNGHRQPRTFLFAEFVEIPVMRVTSDEAPVAASWTGFAPPRPWETPGRWNLPSCRLNDPVALWGAGEGAHTVFFENRHWLALPDVSEGVGVPATALTEGAFARAVENGRFNGMLALEQISGPRKIKTVDADPTPDFETVYGNARSQSFARAEHLRLLSVDGKLYIPCDQPAFRIAVAERLDDRVRVPIVDVWERSQTRRNPGSRGVYLPLSHAEEAAAVAADYIGYDGEIAWPTVHLPEAFSADEDLRVAADFEVSEFARKSTGPDGWTSPIVGRYFDHAAGPDGKLECLLGERNEWNETHTRNGPHYHHLHRAIDLLESLSIDLELGATEAPTRHGFRR